MRSGAALYYSVKEAKTLHREMPLFHALSTFPHAAAQAEARRWQSIKD